MLSGYAARDHRAKTIKQRRPVQDSRFYRQGRQIQG